jgi:hypothetical protein
MPARKGRWWLTEDSEQVVINATPQHVYDLIADLPRMGEWSLPSASASSGWAALRDR